MEELYTLLKTHAEELRSLLVKINAGIQEEKPVIPVDMLQNEYNSINRLIWVYDMEREVLKKAAEKPAEISDADPENPDA